MQDEQTNLIADLKRLVQKVQGKVDPDVHVIRREVQDTKNEVKEVKRLIYFVLALIVVVIFKQHYWP